MPAISTITKATDNNGLHLLVNARQLFARVNSRVISVIGTEVDAHMPLSPPHKPPSQGGSCLTATGAAFARINSIPMCRNDDLATCGHINEDGEAFARISGAGSGAGPGDDWGSITEAPSAFSDYGGVLDSVGSSSDWGTL